MSDVPRFIVAENPSKKVEKDVVIEAINREELVVLLVASGIETVRVMGENYRMEVEFVADEIKGIVNDYSSGSPVMIEYGKVVAARSWWNDLVSLWKAKLKNQ